MVSYNGRSKRKFQNKMIENITFKQILYLVAIGTGCIISITSPDYQDDAFGNTIGAILLISIFID